MARPSRDVEIIEVLDPDDPALDWQVARHSPFPETNEPSANRRRWPWVAVGLVVVGAVTAVVVSAVRGDPRPEPPPALADSKYLIDNSSVRSYSADIVTQPDDNGYFALLARGTPEDGWISVAAQRPSMPTTFGDSNVDVVDGLTMAHATDDPLSTAVVLGPFSGWTVLVRSMGLPVTEVSNFARGLQVESSSTGVQVTWGVPGSGRQIVTSARSSDEALFGRVDTRMTYLDDRSDVITLRVAAGDLDEHARTLSYMAERPPETIGGRVIATLPDTGESLVMWEQDGHLLSLTGVVDPATLLTLSGEVRRATEDEWQTRLIFLRPDYRMGAFTSLADGDGWLAGIQRAERGGIDKYLWRFTVPADRLNSAWVPVRFDPITMPFADRIVIDGVTYVFVSMPGSSGVTSATVYVADGPGIDLTLRPAFDDVDAVFAAYRVVGPGDVRVFSPGVQSPQSGLLPDPLK